jgi:ABC-type transporter Mla MlaB component
MAMPASQPRTVGFAIGERLARADLPTLCERVSAVLDTSGAAVAVCDVSKADADAVTVDALARLQLTARRRGATIQLARVSSDLLDLLAFAGLAEVLANGGGER